jgi:hypothetical protein
MFDVYYDSEVEEHQTQPETQAQTQRPQVSLTLQAK